VENVNTGYWSNGISVYVEASGGGGTPTVTGEEDDTYDHSLWVVPNAYFSVFGSNLQTTQSIYITGYYPEITYVSATQVNGYANVFPQPGGYDYMYLISATNVWTEVGLVYIY
jgi:hypothetical protein